MFVILLGMIELIANKFFDNAAMKDACADSGGAWDHQKDTCQFGPTDPRSKNNWEYKWKSNLSMRKCRNTCD